jgi:hypothetical protein
MDHLEFMLKISQKHIRLFQDPRLLRRDFPYLSQLHQGFERLPITNLGVQIAPTKLKPLHNKFNFPNTSYSQLDMPIHFPSPNHLGKNLGPEGLNGGKHLVRNLFIPIDETDQPTD